MFVNDVFYICLFPEKCVYLKGSFVYSVLLDFCIWWHWLKSSLAWGCCFKWNVFLQGKSSIQHLSCILCHLGVVHQTFNICRQTLNSLFLFFMWVHSEIDTLGVDRWEENKEDFCRFEEIWWTNEAKTASRGREEDIKEGEEQRFYWRTRGWVTVRIICSCVVCFFHSITVSQRERFEYETQLERKWQQWKHRNSWMTSKALEKHCFQVISVRAIAAIVQNTHLPAYV